MISAWTIYFIGIVDSLRDVCSGLSLISALGLIICFIGLLICIDGCEESKTISLNLKRWAKVFLFSFLFMTFASIFVPQSKTLTALYVIPAITNNEKMQNIGKNSIDILEELTTKWLQDLKDDTSRGKK